MTSVIAHRGWAAGARENTVEAFRAAAAAGCHGAELDVRRTADGVLVVHHDPAVPGLGPIVAQPVAALPGWLPTLEAALDACEGMEIVNAEVKNVHGEPDFDASHRVVFTLVEALAGSPWHDRVLVSSFDLATVDRARSLDPGLRTGVLSVDVADPLRALAVAVRHGHGAFHPHDLVVNAEVVEAAHADGLVVNVWTVDDPDRIRALADMGVDGIITNHPDVAFAALGHPHPG